MSHRWLLVLLGLLLGLTGCAAPREHICARAAPVEGVRGVVFVADGAGGFLRTSTALQAAVDEAGVPLQVETVEWSHGFGRVFADQMGYEHARDEGSRLAETILAYKRACPQMPLSLVGHSAGSAVVLSAADALPPNTLEEIVLLAPAVSADYEVRPALRSARRGMDVFSSERDVAYLGAGTTMIGTTDRRWSAAAGRVGFHLSGCPEDAALYSRLRPHPWDSSMAWTGNRGGHYGAHERDFLRAYVVPLLAN